MDDKVKLLELIEEEDDCGWGVRGQEVFDGNNQVFSVYNLNDCPEDAIIGRSLFDAYDWARAVRYGIKLAGQGYTNIELFSKGTNG